MCLEEKPEELMYKSSTFPVCLLVVFNLTPKTFWKSGGESLNRGQPKSLYRGWLKVSCDGDHGELMPKRNV